MTIVYEVALSVRPRAILAFQVSLLISDSGYATGNACGRPSEAAA